MGFGVGAGARVVAMFALAVGAKVSLVCCGPGKPVPRPFATLVCLDFSPPLGDASFPFVLVDFRLLFVLLTMVTLVGFGTSVDVTARAGQRRLP